MNMPPTTEMGTTTLWGVTSYDLGGNAGYVVHCLFSTKEEAENYAAVDPGYDVEEFTLYDKAPTPYTLWVRIAHIYPDGKVEEWSRTETCQAPVEFTAVEDRDLFDGHLQGHCGFHLYVSGTDKDAVEQVFQQKIEQGRKRSTGTCSCGRTAPFKRDFWDGL